MSHTSEIRVLTAAERAELKQSALALASHKVGASDKRWRRFRLLHTPDLTLGTLAYVEQLEAERDTYRTGCRMLEELHEPLQERIAEWEKAFAEQYKALAKAEAKAAGLQQELADQEREKLALVQENAERGKKLYQALAALAGMWNQYCPPGPVPGHMFMSAGEEAEDVLVFAGMMRANETAIDPEFEHDELPEEIKSLVVRPTPAASPSTGSPAAERITCIHEGCQNEHVHDGHCACYIQGNFDAQIDADAEREAGSPAPEGEPTPEYDDFIRLATADEPVWVPTRDTWDSLSDQGKRKMMQVADLKPKELKKEASAATLVETGKGVGPSAPVVARITRPADAPPLTPKLSAALTEMIQLAHKQVSTPDGNAQ